MRFTSEPAYRTLTGPDPVAEEEGDAGALLLVALAGAEELDELDELDELQPAAASAAQSSAPTAALRPVQPARSARGDPWKIFTG
jgi:hypothetical protein